MAENPNLQEQKAAESGASLDDPLKSEMKAPSAASESKPKVEEVKDLYEMLNIDSSASLAEIAKLIEEKRRLSKVYKGITAKREEATILQEVVLAASPIFKTEETRAAYDAKLKAYRESKVENQLMADDDYYERLQLSPVATVDMIELALKKLAANPDMAERAAIIREVLLDPAKKLEYDKQLAAKKAYNATKAKLTPVPLQFGKTEISDTTQLESVIDTNPELGLERLADGEIAAWVEWGLGKRSLALAINNIASSTQSSDAPYMELDRFLRMFNASRPLVLYKAGQKPGQGEAPVIKKLDDVVTVAERAPELMIQRFDHLQSWMSALGHGAILDRLETAGPEGTTPVQLERMLSLVKPDIELPKYSIEGLEASMIDFGELGRVASPTMQFRIVQSGRGFLYGRVAARDSWITVDTDAFEGPSTTVTVGIDRSQLKAGQTYAGKIGIRVLDGRGPNTIIPVTIYIQTMGDVFQNIGTKFKELGSKIAALFKRKS